MNSAGNGMPRTCLLMSAVVISMLPRDNFSPESGGKVKPRTAMLEMRRQGMMRLEK